MAIDPDDWEKIDRRIASARETGINEGIAQARHPCNVRGFSEDQVSRLIHKTTSHLPAGRDFLLGILDSDGVLGFDDLLQQANEATHDDGVLDFKDLKPHQRDILQDMQSGRRLKNPMRTELSRRDMLAWGISALATGGIVKNAVIGLDHALNSEEKEEPKKNEAWSEKTIHRGAEAAEAIAPIVEVGLCAVVLHDNLKDRTKEKMDQVNRAITLFSREARKGVQAISTGESYSR